MNHLTLSSKSTSYHEVFYDKKLDGIPKTLPTGEKMISRGNVPLFGVLFLAVIPFLLFTIPMCHGSPQMVLILSGVNAGTCCAGIITGIAMISIGRHMMQKKRTSDEIKAFIQAHIHPEPSQSSTVEDVAFLATGERELKEMA